MYENAKCSTDCGTCGMCDTQEDKNRMLGEMGHDDSQFEFYVQSNNNCHRVAVAMEDGVCAKNFEDTKVFKSYEIDKKLVDRTDLLFFHSEENSISLAEYLRRLHINTVICGHIKDESVKELTNLGLEVIANERGSVDFLVKKFIRSMPK